MTALEVGTRNRHSDFPRASLTNIELEGRSMHHVDLDPDPLRLDRHEVGTR
jgi:hypothetical protein